MTKVIRKTTTSDTQSLKQKRLPLSLLEKNGETTILNKVYYSQGSVLGAFLFMVFISDVTGSVQPSDCYLYCDHHKLFSSSNLQIK